MTHELRYGAHAAVQFDAPLHPLSETGAAAGPSLCAVPHGAPLHDVTTATHEALANPLGLPALSRAVVPGDRVVIAVESDTPQLTAVLTAILETLSAADIAPTDVEILYDDSSAASEAADFTDDLPARLRDELPSPFAEEVAVTRHDPADRDRLGYLAADDEARPIYLSRHLTDADVVIPVGCCRHEHAAGYHGIATGLHPTFSDTETRNRFRATSIAAATAVQDPAAAAASSSASARHRKEVAHVAWLLGVQYAVQIIPAAGDAVLEVLVGDFATVAEQSRDHFNSAWNVRLPRPADLVIVAVEGGPQQQTWQNLGRALATATRLVAAGGSIAVCTELAEPPGPACDAITRLPDPQEAHLHFRQSDYPDTLPATQLLAATAAARVYLLSHLDEDLVEALGCVHVDAPEEIARLAAQHPDCLVLASAQHADAAILA